MKRGLIVAGLALALAACRGDAPVPGNGAVIEAGARLPLLVESGGRSHRFEVEVARTEAEQAEGLMHRTMLAPDAGMLFPFPAPRIASFWMENTAIPLDIIFVRTDGTIARIAENTVPYSREPVSSLEPVGAVLEIAGGRAAELGLGQGDRVSWPGGPGLNPPMSTR